MKKELITTPVSSSVSTSWIGTWPGNTPIKIAHTSMSLEVDSGGILNIDNLAYDEEMYRAMCSPIDKGLKIKVTIEFFGDGK